MSTEDGLPKVSSVRRKIEILRRRHDFLVWRIEAMTAAGAESHTGFDWAERSALEWALPVLEAEWDNLARLRRETGLDAVERAEAGS